MKILKAILIIVLIVMFGFLVYWRFFAFYGITNQLNTIQSEHSKIEVQFSKLNNDSLQNVYNTIKDNLSFIQQHLDTTDKKTALLLANYNSLKQPIGTIIKNNSKVRAELDLLNNQFQKLTLDVKERTINEAIAEKSIKSEQNQLLVLETQIEKTEKLLPNLKQQFNKFEPQIESIIKRLIAKH